MNVDMLSSIRYYFDLCVDFLFGSYYDSKVVKIPQCWNNLVLEGAVTLAQKIREREVTSEQVVRAFIDRINQVNPVLNAVVDQRFEEAIEEARTIDDEISSGGITEEDFKKKPFLGVPFTVKESIAAKGLSHTLGLPCRKSHKASFDSCVTGRLKNSGAILIAVTNIPTLNGWQETSNTVYGTTNNPYNTTRTVGGSSGGEACIVAACGSPIGIGTELGGSIRCPAFSCGVFGHKLSSHLVPLTGIMFNKSNEKNSLASVGPLTRYSEDIIPILKVLVGEKCQKLKLDDSIQVKDIRIFYVLNPGDPGISFRNEMITTMLKAVKYFTTTQSEKPIQLNIKELKYGGKLWFYLLSQNFDNTFSKNLTNAQGEVSTPRELLKYCFRRSDFNIFVILALISKYLPKVDAAWAKKIQDILVDNLTATLGTNGVLLYPSAPYATSYHYTSVFRLLNMNLFTIWNALSFCVTQVPMGLNHEGVPLGVQVVAPPYQDHLTVAVAKELEAAFGGYVPPFNKVE